MTHHSQLSDVQFESLFEKGDLPPSLFDHEAHLRLAWLYIDKYGAEKAADKSCADIKRFDALHGDGTKFNVTVTIAAVKTVQHFMGKSKSKEFYGFIAEFPRLKLNFKALLDQHYDINVFTDERAKISFVEPNILPFD